MTGKAQACLLAFAFPKQFRLRVGRGGVGVVAAFLPLKVAPVVAVTRALVVTLRPEALHRCPGFDQGAVDTEVVVRSPAVLLRQVNHLGEEQIRNFMFEQPFLILAVGRCIEHRLIKRHVCKPAEHQVGLHPRTKLPVRPDRVERLQDLSLQQCLRRNRRPPFPRVNLFKVSTHPDQNLVAHRLDPANRVVRRDQLLHIDQTDEGFLRLALSSHCI